MENLLPKNTEHNSLFSIYEALSYLNNVWRFRKLNQEASTKRITSSSGINNLNLETSYLTMKLLHFQTQEVGVKLIK